MGIDKEGKEPKQQRVQRRAVFHRGGSVGLDHMLFICQEMKVIVEVDKSSSL